MSNGADLLRMLEPAVRPGGLAGGPGARPQQVPIEGRDFDSLLTEARAMGDAGVSETTAEGLGSDGVIGSVGMDAEGSVERVMLDQLSGVDRIENGSVVEMFKGKQQGSSSRVEPGPAGASQ